MSRILRLAALVVVLIMGLAQQAPASDCWAGACEGACSPFPVLSERCVPPGLLVCECDYGA
jgi:hypothetical protein